MLWSRVKRAAVDTRRRLLSGPSPVDDDSHLSQRPSSSAKAGEGKGSDSTAEMATLMQMETKFMSFKRPVCCSGVVPLEGALQDLAVWYKKVTNDNDEKTELG